jgi:murein DD-endopeptidase MepM/ murein hydrolase activator NlpD
MPSRPTRQYAALVPSGHASRRPATHARATIATWLILAAAGFLGACNYARVPTGPAREMTSQAIRLTMTSVIAAVSTAATATPAPPATAVPPPAVEPSFPAPATPPASFTYTTRPGDTLVALAGRFGIAPQAIAAGVPERTYLPVGLTWMIPNGLGEMSPAGLILPDGAFVYGPAAATFDVEAFVVQSGGYLLGYRERLADTQERTGAQIVRKVAEENSVDPRILLALLEARGGWVRGSDPYPGMDTFPVGFRIPGRAGLYQELSVAATQMNRAYYGWRTGTRVEVEFSDGSSLRLDPTLNAGSAGLIRLYALLTSPSAYVSALAGEGGFAPTYRAMFGDPVSLSVEAGSGLAPGLAQPDLELPFAAGERWSLTAGPHDAWNAGTPRGALDFSPITGEAPCEVSFRGVTAAAPGVIARAEDNAVVLDLDGDGLEQTGWVVVYYHIASEGMIPWGTRVQTGDRLGHPSCEGGRSTGKHVHLARRFNGEWMEADGPVPFVLSGWRAVADERNYYGSLARGDDSVTSDSSGRSGSTIVR